MTDEHNGTAVAIEVDPVQLFAAEVEHRLDVERKRYITCLDAIAKTIKIPEAMQGHLLHTHAAGIKRQLVQSGAAKPLFTSEARTALIVSV